MGRTFLRADGLMCACSTDIRTCYCARRCASSRLLNNNMSRAVTSEEVTPKSWRDSFFVDLFSIDDNCRLALAAPRALRRFETSEQGARPLLCSAVAGMMLALTFTCRALLVLLLSESVQADRTAVRLNLNLLWSSPFSEVMSLKLPGKFMSALQLLRRQTAQSCG